MANLFALPKQVPIVSGAVSPGAKANFYLTSTSTPTDTYSDSDLTTAHANPVVADAAGVFPVIYLDPTVSYRLVLNDSDDALIYDEDPIQEASDAALPSGATEGDMLYFNVGTGWDLTGLPLRFDDALQELQFDQLTTINWYDSGASLTEVVAFDPTAVGDSDVEHIAVDVASFTTTSTSYVDVTSAVISASSFTAGEDYLVFSFSSLSANSTTLDGKAIKLTLNNSDVAGTEITSRGSGTNTIAGQPLNAISKFTYSAGDLQFEAKSDSGGSTTAYINDPKLLAINLTDLGTDNYAYSENAYGSGTPYLVLSGWDDLGPSITIGNGSDDWLIFGFAQVTDFTDLFSMGISDGTTDTAKTYAYGHATGYLHTALFTHVHQGAASTTYSLIGQNESDQVSVNHASLFAIRLSAFADHALVTGNPAEGSGGSEYDSYEPTGFTVGQTSNWAIFAGLFEQWTASSYSGSTEVQYDIDGGGYVDDALWTTTNHALYSYAAVTNERKQYKTMFPTSDYSFTEDEVISWKMRQLPAPSFNSDTLSDAFIAAFSWRLAKSKFILGNTLYPTLVQGSNVTLSGTTINTSGATTFGNRPVQSGEGAYISHVSSSLLSGEVTVSTSAPSGGADGDIWLKY